MSADYPLEHVTISRVALLTNPAAGHGDARHATEKALKRFQERGITVHGIQGSSADESRRLAEQAVADDELDALVVCGGDGLIHLALQAQANTGKPLGIIPAGTGNDHAREYRIPRGDATAAVDVIADGFTATTDLGLITPDDDAQLPTWFGTIVCTGFDSLVSDRVNNMSWPHGRNRYNAAIVVEYLNFHSLPFRIETEEGHVIDEQITLAAFGNTRSYGGGMRVCPSANHYDGMLDVTVIGKAGRLKAALSFGSIFKGTHLTRDEVSTFRTRKAHIASEGINVYADGEYVCPLPATVEIVPAAGRYIVSRP